MVDQSIWPTKPTTTSIIRDQATQDPDEAFESPSLYGILSEPSTLATIVDESNPSFSSLDLDQRMTGESMLSFVCLILLGSGRLLLCRGHALDHIPSFLLRLQLQTVPEPFQSHIPYLLCSRERLCELLNGSTCT